MLSDWLEIICRLIVAVVWLQSIARRTEQL